MTRDEKIAKACRLKAAGVRLISIAKSLGVGTETVRGWTFDVPWPPRECYVCGETFHPDHGNQKVCCGENARKRYHEKTRRGRCDRCGAPTGAGSATPSRANRTGLCRSCEFAERSERRAARDAEIIRMWGEGHSLTEVAEALDSTQASIGVAINRLRREGRDVPYRNRGYHRFPQQVAA